MLIRTLAQRCRRFSPLLAAPAALLLLQGQAKAFLTYNIYESAGNVVVQTSGSLNLTGATQNKSSHCGGFDGAIVAPIAVICTGTDPGSDIPAFDISGPNTFNGTASIFASSVSGIFTALGGGAGGLFIIDLLTPQILQLLAAPHLTVKPWLALASPQQA